MALSIKTKTVTGDYLAIAKKTHHRVGEHMYPAKVLKDGSVSGRRRATLDEMILDAISFIGLPPDSSLLSSYSLDLLCRLTPTLVFTLSILSAPQGPLCSS